MKVAAKDGRLAVTLGDLSGIGPEVVLSSLAQGARDGRLLLYGNERVLRRISGASGIPLPDGMVCLPGETRTFGDLPDVPVVLFDFPFPEQDAVLPGTVQSCCGRMAHRFICEAVKDVRAGSADALVTAPIHKEALRLAGVPFPGHTELLASLTGGAVPCMAFFSPRLAVSLVTIHEALADVPRLVTPEKLERVIRLTRDACAARAPGREPRLGVLALNPHAGEHGLFGDEEARVLQPVIRRLQEEGFALSGPLVPDTAFAWLFGGGAAPYDGYVAMYHDQGLIPFKAAAFDSGVNVTLGLPIVRTSPDHGTAFDRAWKGTASPSSMTAAIHLARRLASSRKEST